MATLKRFGIAAGVIFGLVLSAGLLAAIGGNGDLGSTNQAAADTTSSQHTITVSGDGSVLANPDTAHVTLGVQVQDAELANAQSQATTNMNAVLAALKNDGIKDADIKTVNYSIYVNQDPNGKGTVTGYTVMNQVDVKISEIDKVGSIIDDAVSAGANNVGGVQFTVENVDQLIQQARERAMADAQAKAQQLAKLAGVQLGMPVSISEGTTNAPQPYAVSGARDSAAAGSVPIQTGQNEISVSVTVSYGF